VRGFLQRKSNNPNKNNDDPKPQSSRRGKEKFAGKSHMGDNKGKPFERGNLKARELDEMPDRSNDITRATELKLGPFIFD